MPWSGPRALSPSFSIQCIRDRQGVGVELDDRIERRSLLVNLLDHAEVGCGGSRLLNSPDAKPACSSAIVLSSIRLHGGHRHAVGTGGQNRRSEPAIRSGQRRRR